MSMSSDAENQMVLEAYKGLPCRGEGGDERRGYVGWGPGEDATCSQGRTVKHADWPAYLAAMANSGRTVADFYFNAGHTSEECSCCDGSGHTKAYAELDRGFYPRGGGRWSGWGQALTQAEVNLLREKGRLFRASPEDDITPENLHRWLGGIGHDAINRWILVEARARLLGIDQTCEECYGEGRLRTGPDLLSLNVWTMDPLRGSTRVDAVASVRLDELEEVHDHMRELGLDAMRERFGWATGSNMHPHPRFDAPLEAWGPGRGSMHMDGSWFDTGLSYVSWGDFVSEFGTEANDLNLPVDFHFTERSDEEQTVELRSRPGYRQSDGNELPETFGIDLWMTHPRKGADRAIRIRYATREQSNEIRAYFRSAALIHERHFGWVSGNHYAQEPEPEPARSPWGL